MSRSRNRLFVAVTAVTLALVSSGCGESLGGSSADGGDKLKVGLITTLSGTLASSGQDLQDGFNLYLEQHDGRLGGRETEVITVDEGSGPETGVPAATRLINQDRVNITAGVISSSVGLGVRGLYINAQTPLLIANASAREITEPVSDFIWRTSFLNADIAASAAEAIGQDTSNGKVFVISQDYAAGRETANEFTAKYTAGGGTIAGEIFTPFGTTNDWQPYLNKIRKSGASAVYAFYSGSEAVNFVKQYDTFGLRGSIPLYAPGFLTAGDVLEAEGSSAIGTETILHYTDAINTDDNREFVDAYRVDYKRYPSSFSEQGYATAKVIDIAVASAADLSGPALAEAITNVGEITSPRGPWKFGANHSPEQSYYLLKVAQDGDGRLYNEVVRKIGG